MKTTTQRSAIVEQSDVDVQLEAALAAARRDSAPFRAEAARNGLKPHIMIESPFAGKSATAVSLNQLYGRAALRDSLMRGEAPMASHMLYSQTFVLDDGIADERELGMLAGFSWLPLVERVAVYIDRGISQGMEEGIRRATVLGVPVEERSLPEWARG
jgi:hypothetical protein